MRMKTNYWHQQDSPGDKERMEVTTVGLAQPQPKTGDSSPSVGGGDIVLHPRCSGVAKTTGTFLAVLVVGLFAFLFCTTTERTSSTSIPMISSIVEPDEYAGKAKSPGPVIPVISSSGSIDPDGSNGKLQTKTINSQQNNEHDEKEEEQDVNNLRNDAPTSRVLQQEGVDCVLSDETPFVYLMLLKLNSPQDICVGAAADGTIGVLSENDAAQIKNAIVTTFTILAGRYCDPYFRNVTSVEIVRQGISPPTTQSPSSQEGGALTLEIKVLGTLRCKESEEGCDVDKIGLFDLPKQEGTVDLAQPEQTCSCFASNDTGSTSVSNRGPTEPEFMEKLGVVLGASAPSSLDCPDLQVAGCAFGTVFELALAITFANPEAARNASGLIGPEALSTFNEFYAPDDPDLCYPEFRVFQTANIAFQDSRRQMLGRLFHFRSPAEAPSTEPAGYVSPPTSLVKQGPAPSSTVAPSYSPTTLFGGSSTASVSPTQSPSSLFAASSLTMILLVSGVCSECGSEVFLDNDVSARRRLLRESFHQAIVSVDRPLSGRKLQDMSNMTAESNCFCPIDSQVVASPFLALEQFKTTLEERLELEILGIQQVEPGDTIDGLYRYPCSDVATTFQRNVTLEVQATCSSAELSANDETKIESAYITAYNGLGSAVCDPFKLEVTSAKVVETGALLADGVSLPLKIEVTVVCFGCDPLDTNVYGFPQSSINETMVGSAGDSRRHLYEEAGGMCSCEATLPRRPPSEAEVVDALRLSLLQAQEDVGLDCPDLQVAECSFGTVFELALAITFADPEASRNATGRIGPETLSTFNEFYNPGDPDLCYPEFRIFQTASVDFPQASRRLQQMDRPSIAPSQSPTTLFGGISAASVAPTQAPSALFAAPSLTAIVSVAGVCSGCGSEVFLDNDVSARRSLLRESFHQAIVLDRPPSGPRKLQDKSNMTAESNCFCPIDSQVVASPFLALEEFKTTLEERLQLEILGIQQVEPGDTIDGLYRYPCSDVATTFQRNVTLEVQATCSSAELSANDETKIESAYITAYNGLGSAVCDPFKLEVTSAKVVETGALLADGVSLPLKIEVTVVCFGCDPLDTNVYGFPQSSINETMVGSAGDSRRHLYEEAGGMCSCEATLPRRPPSEAEVVDALRLSLLQAQEDVGLDCPDLQVAECSFGTVFELALAITFADPEASRNATGRIGPETLSTFNEFYNPADPDLCYPEFRVFQTASVDFPEASRRLQQMDRPSIAPSQSPTTLFGGISAASVAPTQAPSALFAAPSLTAIVSVAGVCSGCGSEVFLDNDVSARRSLLRESFHQAIVLDRPPSGPRKLQDKSNMTAESNCFCPIDSQVVASPFLALEEFKTTLEERLQLEILGIQQVEPGDTIDGLYRYPCSDVATTFQRNVTLEVQTTCGSAALSANDLRRIELSYTSAYESLRSALCDPFNLEVTTAKAVETGELRADGVSLRLKLEVTVVCFGCDPLDTNVYGFPQSPVNEVTVGGSEGATRRHLYGEGGICVCNSTLPRRAPSEADVIDALRLSLLQDEDAGQTSCVANTTACDFGTGFTSSVLLEVAVNNTVEVAAANETLATDPKETAAILQTAYVNALNRVVGGGNATQCNPWFGAVTNTEYFLEFVYNSVEKSANQTAARRQLQDMAPATEGPTASTAPTSEPTSTFMYSWAGSGTNISDAPTAAPTSLFEDDTQFFVLDASGVCNGCPTELIFNNEANDDRRRRTNNIRNAEDENPRFLQDVVGEVPESDCYCPIGSVEIVPDLQQVSLLQILQEELAELSSTITIVEAVSGLTRVECVAETPFSTTIDFAFSAFEWVVNNPADVQGLGDVIANLYNGLVENFCDDYFRNSISLTFVAGSLQRTTAPAQRHIRDLQNNMQGCFNYKATFSVTGLCRGCQALGTPIPLFGSSTVSRRLLDELVRHEASPQESKQRRLQEAAGLTCLCDSISISQRSAPSRDAVRAGLAALVPDQLPWAQNPSICGLPVQVEVPCPTIPTGPSTTMTMRFFARLTNGGCLTVADFQQISTLFLDAFNSNMQLERFTCEPGYLQVSNVVIDQTSLVGCRRELLRGEKNSGSTSRQLLQDFTAMFATMTVTGNIYATNIDAILAGEGATLRTAADSIAARSLGIYEIETGTATKTPSAMPSAFPSSFPSAFPSSFPSSFPSASPSTSFPSDKPSSSPSADSCLPNSNSCTGTAQQVKDWCVMYSGNCCVDGCQPACAWGGEATIFKGACTGAGACDFGTSERSSIIVSSNSCVGDWACYYVANVSGSTIFIGSDSCRGIEACEYIGEETGVEVVILSNSCRGMQACQDIGYYASSPNTISIGTSSCRGELYCSQIGQEAETIEVGDNSCNGLLVCSQLGRYGASEVLVGKNSCVGTQACENLAANGGGGSISIGDGSCRSSYACLYLGYRIDGTVVIGTGSCLGFQACENLGAGYYATSVNIGDGSCDSGASQFACRRFGYDAESIDIGEGSCLGQSACENVGDAWAGSVVIANGACASCTCKDFDATFWPSVVECTDCFATCTAT